MPVSPEQKIAQEYAALDEASAAQNAPQAAAPVPAPPAGIQAQIPMPGQLQAPAPAAPNPNGGQVYGGGTPDGQLSSTPRQATADTLNNLETGKDLDQSQGDIESTGLTAQAQAQNAAADEVTKHAQDFDTLLAKNTVAHEDDHNDRVNIFKNYMKSAGALKDPAKQFWEDSGTGSKVIAGLASFASGLGSGLLGHAGNPYMDFLSKQIDNNYQSHKQNIEDLYQSAVEAGKIEDTEDNHRRYEQQGKLQSYDFSIEHLKHVLSGIQNSAASGVAKVMAGKAIAGLTQEQIQARQNLAAAEAKADAAKNAGARARQAEIKANYLKFVELHNKDMGDDESRIAALKDLQGQGYNRSELAPLLSGIGAESDPTTGEYVLPKNAPSAAQEPAYDDNGKLILPDKTPSGKRIDPKDLENQRKDITEKTANIDGKPIIFRRKEEAEAVTAIPEAERLQKVMQDAWNAGDKGTYDQAKDQFIEMAPKLLGYKRGPSEAQAGGIDKERHDADDRATIAGQLPKFEVSKFLGAPFGTGIQSAINTHPLGTNSDVGIGLNKLRGVRTTLDAIKKDAMSNAVSQPKASAAKPAAPSKQDLDALTKSLGGK